MSSTSQIAPVWLDCDPGHDDALAIILAGAAVLCSDLLRLVVSHRLLKGAKNAGWHPSIELFGISTVGSNQALAKVTANALSVLDFAGLQHIGDFAHVVTLWLYQGFPSCASSTWDCGVQT